MEVIYGVFIPFLGTGLGAACVFFMKNTMRDSMRRILAGFAAGVMVEAVSCNEASGDVMACCVDEFRADAQPELKSIAVVKTRKDFKKRIRIPPSVLITDCFIYFISGSWKLQE